MPRKIQSSFVKAAEGQGLQNQSRVYVGLFNKGEALEGKAVLSAIGLTEADLPDRCLISGKSGIVISGTDQETGEDAIWRFSYVVIKGADIARVLTHPLPAGVTLNGFRPYDAFTDAFRDDFIPYGMTISKPTALDGLKARALKLIGM